MNMSAKTKRKISFLLAYVADLIERDDISWYPISKALALAKEDTTIEDELEKIWKTLDFLVGHFKEEQLRKQEEELKTKSEKWKEEAKIEEDEGNQD